MRAAPRYDGPEVLRMEGSMGGLSVPLLRQRRRLAQVLGPLDDDQWATPSRCDLWSVRDVVAHLVTTNGFWLRTITAGLAGSPTRDLTDFDPVVHPPQMVAGMAELSADEVLARYRAGVEDLAGVIGGLDEAQWQLRAEGPPGHVSLQCVALHALWDAWVHERDILLPLGITPVEEADELEACLRYVAGLGPVLLANRGSTRSGALMIDASAPDLRVVVEAGATVVVRSGEPPPDAVRLTGRTVELIEALSCRAPLPSGIAAEDRWLFEGIAGTFEQLPSTG